MTLLVGVSNGIALPIVALFIVDDLGGSLADVALYLLLSGTGVVVTLIAGRLSGRTLSRQAVFRGALLLMSIGWVALTIAQRPWQALVVGATFFSVLGVVSSQLFVIGSQLAESRTKDCVSVIASLRSLYALGYVLGPLVGTGISSLLGYRIPVAITAIMYCILLCMSQTLPWHELEVDKGKAGQRPRGRRSKPFTATLVFACVMFTAFGDDLRGAYLGIHLTGNLQAAVFYLGLLLAVSALVEVLSLPYLGLAADRWGAGPVCYAALIVGATCYALLAANTNLVALFVLQVFHALFFATLVGIGPVFIESSTRLGKDISAATFFAALGAARVVAGTLGAITVVDVGIPRIFVYPFFGLVFVLVVCCVYGMARRSHQAGG